MRVFLEESTKWEETPLEDSTPSNTGPDTKNFEGKGELCLPAHFHSLLVNASTFLKLQLLPSLVDIGPYCFSLLV